MILISVIAFRVLNSQIISTTYNPDEYWQSLEVAYKIVNNYGYLTWEWEPCISLRGIIHPLIFTVCYIAIRLLKIVGGAVCGKDSQHFYCISNYYFCIPRLFQSIFAVLTDIGTSKVAYQLLSKYHTRLNKPDTEDEPKADSFGELAVSRLGIYQRSLDKYELDLITLLVSLLSWYNFFTLCRTYSQTIEGCINIWAIYYMIKSDQSISDGCYFNKKLLFTGVLLSSLSVLVRHSSAQFWIVFYLILISLQACDALHRSGKYSSSTVKEVLKACAAVCCLTLPVMIYSDYWFYKKITIPMLNFIKFNLIGDPGQFYGSNSRLYYFTEAPLVTLLSFLPLFLLGARESLKIESKIFKITQVSTLLTVLLLSTASHKEYRFTIPYFPFVLITTSLGIYKAISEIQHSHKSRTPRLHTYFFGLLLNKKCILASLLVQIIPAILFTTVLRRGGESVIRFFSHLSLKEDDSIFFLSQCHMYPAYSYLNQDVKFGFLDCSPPINQASQLQNLNEILWTHQNTSELLEEVFVPRPSQNSVQISPYISPKIPAKENTSNFESCLNYRFEREISGDLPTFFVIHSHFNENLQAWLRGHNYKLINRIFDSFITETPIGYVYWSYFYIYEKT
ncbi:dolichyl-phosphate-mannose-glycolipid alpha-mannosyltransferase [Cryptosporidium canis]|uniref:Mannosyltransferase n=1 Tax=Cryptosporidium canis TaxID=195482 RepID=A0ABQ8PCE6_9CRYT|nr:dolichyl-phosphate-mannose-glycolipid alpha-mannosyltransferase [Cryptosporidium canis]